MTFYYRPLARLGEARPQGAVSLAGTASWFTEALRLSRSAPPQIVDAAEIPMDELIRLTVPRTPVAGLDMAGPAIMGILNVTPDSFSDGGTHADLGRAVDGAARMIADGADILDIGGESTRPGAQCIDDATEIARVVPVIAALRARFDIPLSLDTRKSGVARAGLEAGADLINDVSGATFDDDLAPLCARADVPICLMHAQGDPQTMQDDPRYDDVLLDVFDALAAHVRRAECAGIAPSRIIVDPGIGFGKTQTHNLALLRGLSLFHGLGCPVLLGASRKGFIGRIGNAPSGASRAPGSIAVALAAVQQGIQIVRVHDVAETRQALALWQGVTTGEGS